MLSDIWTLTRKQNYSSIMTCETLCQNERRFFFWKGQIYADGMSVVVSSQEENIFFTNVVIETKNDAWLRLKRHKNTANGERKIFPGTRVCNEIDKCSYYDFGICGSFLFFFYLGFLLQPFTNHRTAGERVGYCFNSFLPSPPTFS